MLTLYTAPSSLVSASDKLKRRLRHCAARPYVPVEDGAVSVGSEGEGGGGVGVGTVDNV